MGTISSFFQCTHTNIYIYYIYTKIIPSKMGRTSSLVYIYIYIYIYMYNKESIHIFHFLCIFEHAFILFLLCIVLFTPAWRSIKKEALLEKMSFGPVPDNQSSKEHLNCMLSSDKKLLHIYICIYATTKKAELLFSCCELARTSGVWRRVPCHGSATRLHHTKRSVLSAVCLLVHGSGTFGQVKALRSSGER